ncbi:histidinol dehydrogenase [marine gamma proteobacterium HTCC2143]|uniref:Histidinol dehydrogenase n=1 Tax=marine gamma proteobacterium HTCC2143 TaxID=247633 RepID=A0YES8_9GAMM|nr:histidinol dehydrogenase [marine gamma proteobacterium HTCC2143]
MSKSFAVARLDTQQIDFDSQLTALLSWDAVSDLSVVAAVEEIISAVKAEGDQALLRYNNRFDNMQAGSITELELSQAKIAQSLAAITAEQRQALELAANRIRKYHQHQRQESWSYTETDGTVLGQQITALEKVGVYVPGGKAAYPSTVLMDVIPAKVAGVEEIIMVTPTPAGVLADVVIAAAAIAGVDRVFTVGGAQAIAALAYGTESIPKVDKIVGPGNIFVATAKRQVFGQVGLDMIAGPSEILVICDGQTDPDWIAMDLFSQAEHDENAQSILVCPDAKFIDRVEESIQKLLPTMERASIIAESLSRRGALIKVDDMAEAMEVCNRIAPEHLELSVADPQALLSSIKHAGAIFMGRHTSEALGDYCAGPNHVLPTSGTVRFSSPLGVYDFQKRSSIIHCSEEGASVLGKTASILARSESLTAHAQSAEFRIIKD